MAYNVSRGTMDAQHLSASTVVYASTELVTEGNLNISGNTNLGDNAGDVITVTGRLTGSQGAYFGGRVGVGTATPDQMLEVSGAVHMAAEQSSPSAPSAGDGGLMYVKPDGNLYWVSDDVSEVSLSSGGGGGISWDGSTANGVATFKDADEATVEANLTFDGSTLTVTGDVTVDKNHSDTDADASIIGINVDFDKTGNSTSNNTMYGLKLDMDNTTATNGTNYMYGLHVTPTLTHAANAGTPIVYGALINAQGGTNGTSLIQGARIEAGGGDINYGLQLDVEDGGVDLRIESSADSGDYFQIQTTTHGATTITTVDDDAAAANLIITADGTVDIDSVGLMTLDSGGAINLEPAAGSAVLIDGTVSIDGGAIAGATTISGSGVISGLSLDVEKGADLNGFGITNTGPLAAVTTISGSSTLQMVGATILGSTLNVSGALVGGSTISGSSTLSAKDLVIDTNQNIGCAGDTDLMKLSSGQLRVRGSIRSDSFITGSGALSVASLTAGGAEVVSKTRALTNVVSATIGGPISGSGMATLVGGVVTEGNLLVSGSSTFGNAIADVTTATGRLTGSAGAYFGGRVGIKDNAPGYDLTLSGAMHFNGNLAAPTPPTSAGTGGILFGSGSGKLYWAAQEILARDISNQYFHKPVGCTFSRASAATVTLNPGGGIDGVGRVSLYKDTTKDIIQYNITASITADLSTSGFNGLDTGSEASDTGYYMYVICKDEGLLPGLLFSTSNINPTMPSGYTYRSQPVWFVANDGSSNILEFKQQGSTGWCWYSDFQNVIDNGQQLQAAGWAAVSFENLVPAESEAALLLRISADITAGATTVRLTVDNSTAPASGVGTYFVNRLSSNGDVASTVSFIWGVGAPSTAMYYAWTADPGSADQGFRVDIGGWKLW